MFSTGELGKTAKRCVFSRRLKVPSVCDAVTIYGWQAVPDAWSSVSAADHIVKVAAEQASIPSFNRAM